MVALAFHPREPWLYVADERRSLLYMFRYPDDRIEPLPAYTCDTLADRANEKPRQLAGTIHLHPSGRYVYVVNRADHTVDFRGRKVFGGGENSIAVFAIDAVSGEPRLIQHADAHAYHVRTFAFDPSGRLDHRKGGRGVDVTLTAFFNHVYSGNGLSSWTDRPIIADKCGSWAPVMYGGRAPPAPGQSSR